MFAVSGAIKIGVAPTSSDLPHRAPASGLEPTMRCMCDVESTAVRSAGAMAAVAGTCVMSVEGVGAHDEGSKVQAVIGSESELARRIPVRQVASV